MRTWELRFHFCKIPWNSEFCKTVKTVFFNTDCQGKTQFKTFSYIFVFLSKLLNVFATICCVAEKFNTFEKLVIATFPLSKNILHILEALAHIALKIQRLCLFELHCHLIGMKIVNKALSFLTPRDTKILVSLFYSYKVTLYKRVISLFSNII